MGFPDPRDPGFEPPRILNKGFQQAFLEQGFFAQESLLSKEICLKTHHFPGICRGPDFGHSPDF